ncbi:MAG TPA: type II toxin-antitoxin system VapC family toxin [Longimicrobiaceae bacterium]|nr:type II toxin-antitoxin system VapC family toxin [Longimicrobiaceae bacterium]
MPAPSSPLRPLLLDTHVWIWVMNGWLGKIGYQTHDAVAQAGLDGRILISAMSVWEIGMLEAKGRIRFSMEAGEWVRRALSAPGVRITPLSPEVAIDSSRLPDGVHGDPADRMLIATARRVGATLVTRDLKILEYGQQGILSVLDVRT